MTLQRSRPGTRAPRGHETAGASTRRACPWPAACPRTARSNPRAARFWARSRRPCPCAHSQPVVTLASPLLHRFANSDTATERALPLTPKPLWYFACPERGAVMGRGTEVGSCCSSDHCAPGVCSLSPPSPPSFACSASQDRPARIRQVTADSPRTGAFRELVQLLLREPLPRCKTAANLTPSVKRSHPIPAPLIPGATDPTVFRSESSTGRWEASLLARRLVHVMRTWGTRSLAPLPLHLSSLRCPSLPSRPSRSLAWTSFGQGSRSQRIPAYTTWDVVRREGERVRGFECGVSKWATDRDGQTVTHRAAQRA